MYPSYRNQSNVCKYQLSATILILATEHWPKRPQRCVVSVESRQGGDVRGQTAHTHTQKPRTQTAVRTSCIALALAPPTGCLRPFPPAPSIILRSANLSLFYSWKFCFYTSLSLSLSLSLSHFPLLLFSLRSLPLFVAAEASRWSQLY